MLKSRISWDSWQSITKLQGYSTPLFPCPSLIHVIYSEWRWRHDWDSLDSSIFHDNCKLTTFYPSHSLMRPPFPPLVPPPPAVAALRTPSYIALSLCLHFFFFFWGAEYQISFIFGTVFYCRVKYRVGNVLWRSRHSFPCIRENR